MKKYWPFLLLIVLFAIVIRFPTFLPQFVNIDENEYAMAAQKILAGGLPYKDFLIYQPPMIFYVYSLGFFLSGGTHIWAAQIITIAFVAGTVLALYFLASGVAGNKRAGLAAAFAYAAFSTTFLPQDMLAANCEILMMLPLTLSVLMLYYADKRVIARNPKDDEAIHHDKGNYFADARNDVYFLYLLTGIFAGIGFLTKYQGGVVIAAEVFYVLILTAFLRRKFSLKENLFPSIILTVGFFIPIMFVGTYLWHKGAGKESWEAFTYILLYAKGPVQNDPLYLFLKFTSRTALIMLPAIVMWIGAFAMIKSAIARGGASKQSPERHFILFSILWLFISFVPVLMGGRIYFHYYFTTLPPAALLFGIWWAESAASMKKWVKGLAIFWTILTVTGWMIASTWIPVRDIGKKNDWTEVAQYLQEIKNPDDTLFVWGYCPQIYIQSGMRNPTRFTTTDYLTGRSPMTAGLEYDPNMPNPPSSWRKFLNDYIDPSGVVVFDTSANIFPKAWEYLRSDFERELPKYIIDTSPSNYRRYARYPIENFPYLSDILKKNYVRVNSIKGFQIYRSIN